MMRDGKENDAPPSGAPHALLVGGSKFRIKRTLMLSVIIPAFNEARTLSGLLERVIAAPLGKEIIVVDDGSTDETPAILASYEGRPGLKVITHARNLGKGMAVRSAIPHITGEAAIIQDADLEYDPQDYSRLLEPVAAGTAQVVFGGRRGLHQSSMVSYVGGRLLSLLADLLYRQQLMDMSTGYKLFDSRLLKSLPLRCTGFEFCAEVTARIGKRGIRIHEIPIRYQPRSVAAGKKIRWLDGVVAAWILLKYRFVD